MALAVLNVGVTTGRVCDLVRPGEGDGEVAAWWE